VQQAWVRLGELAVLDCASFSSFICGRAIELAIL
jgi:hypothetical protein